MTSRDTDDRAVLSVSHSGREYSELECEQDDDQDSTRFTIEKAPSTGQKKRFASRKLTNRGLIIIVVHVAIVCLLVAAGTAAALGLGIGLQKSRSLPTDPYQRAQALLSESPVADGLVFFFPNYEVCYDVLILYVRVGTTILLMKSEYGLETS